MNDISKRFESFIRSANKNLADQGIVLPRKSDRGIEIGDVLIVNKDNLKYVYFRNSVYAEIYLNNAAIEIATLLALRKNLDKIDDIYRSDQEYGKWFVDNQHLLALHKRARDRGDFERADTLWARYQESRDRAQSAKNKVERLIGQR